MDFSEICIHTTNEAVEPISNIMHEFGASGVVIEDPVDLQKTRNNQFGEIYDLDTNGYPVEGVNIKAYLPVHDTLDETIAKMKQAINHLTSYGIDIGHNEVTISEINEEAWANSWKKYYKPAKVSEHVTITPTWIDYETQRTDELVIELDPGMAFGTGTHPTTVLTIQAMERYLNQDDIVLDVGCGSGVLSIAAGLLGAEGIYAYDLDEVAVESTKANVAVNKLTKRVETRQNNLLVGIHKQADMIVSNILAEIIVQFTDDAFHNLKPCGVFITSGIIKDKHDLVKEQLLQSGFDIIETNVMEDWISITCRKPE